MSINLDFRRDLESSIASNMSIRSIVERLHEYRRLGARREEVLEVLETLRKQAPDESVEDRILEVMDFAAGFCRAEDIIWKE